MNTAELHAAFAAPEVLARGHFSALWFGQAEDATERALLHAWDTAPTKPRLLHRLCVDEGAPAGVQRSDWRTVSGGAAQTAVDALDAQVDAVLGDTKADVSRLMPRQRRRATLARPMGFASRAPATAAVIGAGLAGAAVARALSLRGWRVRLIEPAGALGMRAQPASEVPAAHFSAPAGDTLDARVLRSGIAHTLEVLQATRGVRWARTGERSGWVEPPSLIHALIHALMLEHGIEATRAATMDALQTEVNAAEIAVLCAGAASAELARALGWATDALATAHPVPGQVLVGQTDAQSPNQTLEGDGHFIGGLSGGRWLMGASYSRTPDGQPIIEASPLQIAAEQAANIARLERLLGARAQPLLARSTLSDWRGIRTSTRDRRPIVGQLVESLDGANHWVLAGLGSRGASWAFLCAELLAAWLHGEPLPVEARTARALSANRFAGQ